MKKIKVISTIVLSIVVFGVMVVTSSLLQNQGESEAVIFTTETRAAAITYKRKFSIKAKGSMSTAVTLTPGATTVLSPSPTPFIFLSPSVTLSSSASGTLTPTEIPLIVSEATETPSASQAATPSLPVSGWMQNSLILFITASTVIFISFIF